MNGAASFFNFSWGFGLALLREWFFPALLALLFIVIVAFIWALKRR